MSRFLLRRALTKPRLIGHIYYWLLQSEVYNVDVSKRYVILLQVGSSSSSNNSSCSLYSYICFLCTTTALISPAYLLQVYIRNCGSHRIEIGHQMFVMKRLESVAEAVVLGDSKDERKRILKERLSEIVLPTTFKLPLSPHLNVYTYIYNSSSIYTVTDNMHRYVL